jgi:hypothetical protein
VWKRVAAPSIRFPFAIRSPPSIRFPFAQPSLTRLPSPRPVPLPPSSRSPSLRSLIGWGKIKRGVKLEVGADGVAVAPAPAAAAAGDD